MITKKDISKGVISNTHISKSAEIDPSKLKGDKIGSILIADRDGKYVARKVRGDATLLPSGEFRIASNADAGEVTQEEVRNAGGVIGRDIKHDSTLVGERDGTPKEVHVGTGSNAIPKRDASGNLQAEKIELVNELPTPSAGKIAYDGKFKVAESSSWDEVTTANNTQTLDNKTISGGLFTT